MTLRDKVYERDQGICAKCGLDTKTLMEVGILLMTQHGWGRSEWKRLLSAIAVKTAPGLTYWQADHIIATMEGGPDELDNMQTLCIPCHDDDTKTLLARKRRIPGKVWEFKARLRRQRRS